MKNYLEDRIKKLKLKADKFKAYHDFNVGSNKPAKEFWLSKEKAALKSKKELELALIEFNGYVSQLPVIDPVVVGGVNGFNSECGVCKADDNKDVSGGFARIFYVDGKQVLILLGYDPGNEVWEIEQRAEYLGLMMSVTLGFEEEIDAVDCLQNYSNEDAKGFIDSLSKFI
ncbi:hypothetical protein Phi39:1_gp47 [Cellulophaga phage phi39:1]|uniref:hypothetical protein n=1 Tax=Cellulophaga phage phi39:1 TaxID=1327993 RepID=UPI000351F8F5|nr:hypothetical protein Phi39:1_gp47 [Cellulophaga phage phi39:1]AGO49162.1 hypothetical protein Phi39:1_gp47 [Cellulophaga phage phi39:1]